MRKSRLLSAAATTALILVPALAYPHGNEAHRQRVSIRPILAEEHPFGRQGDPAKVSRTVTVDMSDAMRFSPSEIRVRQGETIRFVVRNRGNAMHEMVIGTLLDLKAHGEVMKKYPNMEHDEPYMAHVTPDGSEEIVWTFTKAGEFHYGCLVPGHFDSGMIGKVVVSAN